MDARPATLAPRLRRLQPVSVCGHEVRLARGVRARTLGLALLPRSRAGAGLLIPRCASVHTLGMRFCLDLYFLDEAGTVVAERARVRPGRLVSYSEASAVLELPSAPA